MPIRSARLMRVALLILGIAGVVSGAAVAVSFRGQDHPSIDVLVKLILAVVLVSMGFRALFPLVARGGRRPPLENRIRSATIGGACMVLGAAQVMPNRTVALAIAPIALVCALGAILRVPKRVFAARSQPGA